MSETPQVVIRTRRVEPAAAQKDFIFTPEMVRTSGVSETLRAYRLSAWEAFKNLKMPVTTEEAWRRTDLRAMKPDTFHFPEKGAYLDLSPAPDELLRPVTDSAHGGEVLLLPGGSRISVDPELKKRGLVFTDLLTAEKQYPELLDKIIGTIVKPGEGKFSGLAGALAQNGVLLYVPSGMQVAQPLHSLLWGPGANLAYISHLLVYLEEGSSVTYVHEAASPTEASGQSLHAGIVEIFVGDGARLNFVELQSWGEHVWNLSHERARLDQNATMDWIFGAIGSHVTKNFTEIDLKGQGSTGRMSGFYFTDHDQHLDHDTQQNHLAPHTTSDLLFKGALSGESRSVWQGMIYVAPGAMKTDGYQANRNLVLSSKARADSIPGLEILADDVRCTHGATVGKIDSEQVFYLLSRGVPRQEAERLIVEGFFDPIMQRIPFEGVKQRFQESIHRKMESYAIE
ncbi:MAG TPA: Fe-S cluster assembly protein SufD [Anaerolineaceae bacterium]|nr:Fe-S cluster assembly protein SufD [Anaerolineaceae bacterium]